MDFDPSIYELDSGHRPLPAGLEGHGLYIQGHNRSDDLFMFFKRQVTGLKPDAEYSAVLSLELATNVAAGLVGIGGSPGESVYVKAGASTLEPLVPEDERRILQDEHRQGQPVQRRRVDGGRRARGPPRRDRRGVPHQDPRQLRPVRCRVTADGEGRLWLIVGTDSGFEGLSAFYYARIACTLTPLASAKRAHIPLAGHI